MLRWWEESLQEKRLCICLSLPVKGRYLPMELHHSYFFLNCILSFFNCVGGFSSLRPPWLGISWILSLPFQYVLTIVWSQ